MRNEDEIREKQEYLRLNILEKGYDADEFQEYLKTLKGENALDIGNWSKNDLIKAVVDFTKIYQNNIIPQNQDNQEIQEIHVNQEIQENQENQENQEKQEKQEKQKKQEKQEKLVVF